MEVIGLFNNKLVVINTASRVHFLISATKEEIKDIESYEKLRVFTCIDEVILCSM